MKKQNFGLEEFRAHFRLIILIAPRLLRAVISGGAVKPIPTRGGTTLLLVPLDLKT